MLAPHVGKALKGCTWVGVPFAGGMCEVAHLDARTIAVNDLHRHVVNLAAVVGDPELKPRLVERLAVPPFHPGALAAAQARCRGREADEPKPFTPAAACVSWAADYFVCSWMARASTAGTAKEFDAPLSMRWEAGGGDSVVRFRNAVKSLDDWHGIMVRCTFTTLDVFDFLAKCKDAAGHGIYCDPPFPGPGDGYKHKFGEDQHRRLADELAGFVDAKIVCRFYDVPLVRELYPAESWDWHPLEGRKQTNGAAPEVLLVSKPGRPKRQRQGAGLFHSQG